MKHIITGTYQGKKITRTALSDFQAFVIINQLNAEGVTEIGMREETADDRQRNWL
jgi:hypothetical protein